MVGAALGYPVELVMASNVSRERKKIIEAFGAKPIYSDPLEGSDGAIVLCRKIIDADPDRYFKPDQYNNEANPLAHFETTGPEIWRQTGGGITHFRRRDRHQRHHHGHRPLPQVAQSGRSK